jgi:CoA:oxalate CoA-transferase
MTVLLPTEDERPLEGIRVVDLSVTLPGPYCTQVLRRLGASVIHLEPPGGDTLRWVAPTSFAYLAEGKESVIVDLKEPVDHKLALALLAEADIVVQGWRPGVADRLGVGHRAVAALNPGAVYCSLSGYGETGELAGHPGHDINYAAESGALDLVRTDGIPVGDLAGASTAGIRILAALLRAQRTGRGVHVEVSIAGAIREWVQAIGGREYEKFLTVYQAPHYGTFETGDGERVVLGIAQEQRLWSNLITALGRTEWADMPYAARVQQADTVRAFLAERIRSMSIADIEATFATEDTCWTIVRRPGDPTRISGVLPDLGGSVPALDQHGPHYRKTRSAS